MSNEKYEQINANKKTTSSTPKRSIQNTSEINVFNTQNTRTNSSNHASTHKKSVSGKNKSTTTKKKKNTPKRNPTVHKFFNFVEKNFTPISLIVVAALIIVCIFLIGAICGFKLHQTLQKKNRIENFAEYIEKASEEFDVPYDIIYAVIETESSFDPYAESSSKARGLMQITELTLTDINQNLNTNYSIRDLFDPEINIRLGTSYLARLYERFGNYDTVYAAYNAGPTIVSEWLKDENYSTDGKTLIHNEIPYEETKRYVEKVNAFRDNYLAKQN